MCREKHTRKWNVGGIDKNNKQQRSDLWPALQWGAGGHKQRKWEKEVDSGSRSFLASSTSRSSWLFGQTKAADNAGAAVLTAWSWGVMKGTHGGGGAVRMFMQDDCAQGRGGEGRDAQWADECKHRHTRWQSTSPEQQLLLLSSLSHHLHNLN